MASSSRSCRILVVEDNLDSARTLYFLLRDMGQDVQFAINGYAAVEIARSFRPEIIFLDIGLPDMDGYELAERLHKDLGDKVVLVALTGYGSEEDKQRAYKAGFKFHLTKPVSLADVEEVLAKIPAPIAA